MAEPIRVTHRYAAPPEQVFDAWLDPARARRFAFATPDGEMIRADIDAKIGGRFTFTDRRPEMGDVEHVGEYEVIERPRRLVFTFAVPKYDPNYTRVSLDFAPADGGCEVTLTHHGVPAEWEEGSRQGWTMILAAAEKALWNKDRT